MQSQQLSMKTERLYSFNVIKKKKKSLSKYSLPAIVGKEIVARWTIRWFPVVLTTS